MFRLDELSVLGFVAGWRLDSALSHGLPFPQFYPDCDNPIVSCYDGSVVIACIKLKKNKKKLFDRAIMSYDIE